MNTLKQHEAIQNIYNYFNKKMFANSLDNCILNFSRKSKAYGFFAPLRWNGREEKVTLHEISLNPEHLKRTPREVVSTLVHEMCHLWQQDHGKPSNGYHNKEFAAKMKSVGLHCSNTGEPGGKETGKNMIHYILEGGQFENFFNLMPKEFLYPFVCISEQAGQKAKKAAKNKTKYSCGCGVNIWGKPGLLVTCTDCEETFLEV